MNSAAVFFAFVLCNAVAHVSTVALSGPITLTVGAPIALTAATVSAPALGALAAAGGLAALAVVKGVIIGAHHRVSHHRYQRSISNQEDEETSALMLEVAQKMDSAGCMAKLICELVAMPVEQLSPAALTLKSAFSEDSKLMIGAYAVAFNTGSKLAKNNPEACDLTYTSCPLPKSKLFHMMDTTFSC